MVNAKRTQPKRKINKNNKKKNSRFSKSISPPIVSGQGDYLVDMGQSVGKWLGGKAGSLISSIVSGSGDYHVKTNSLMNSVPDFSNSAETRIRMREFLCDVIGQPQFQSRVLPLGVTEIGTFPYLSRLAKAFDEWELNGLLFTYKTTSGSVTTSQSLGTVILATQYNPYDKQFTSKQEMENYQYSSSTVPSESCIHAVECDPSLRQQPVLSVLAPNGPTSQDKRLYQFGQFSYATVGFPNAATVCGELWVTYDITLRVKAQRALTVYQEVLLDGAQLATVNDVNPFGTSQIDLESGPLASLNGNTLTFRDGVYGRFLLQYYQDTTNPVSTNTLYYNNLGPTIAYDEVYASQRNFADANQLGAEVAIDVNGGGTLDLSVTGATGAGAATYVKFTVIEIPK